MFDRAVAPHAGTCGCYTGLALKSNALCTAYLERQENAMPQEFHCLSDDDTANLEAMRRWVREHYEPEAEHKYQTLEGKIALLDTIISNHWIKPDEKLKLQCLGITFGDALAQRLGFEWRMVEDEDGRGTALVQTGTTIVLFPQTMISKRIEAGEVVDVYDLFNATCDTVQRLLDEGA